MNRPRNNSNPQQHRGAIPEKAPLPYGFDAVEPAHAIHDAPAWRDGSNNEQRLSGELLITLEALSPLIVGNHHYRNNEQQGTLAPQLLDDGRVILGGTGLKGMLRSAMASLLQAPMERVQEHHYTYRPNLGFGPKDNPKREFRAAIVTDIDTETGAVSIGLLPAKAPIVFVRSDAFSQLPECKAGSHINGSVPNVKLTGDMPRQRLDHGDGNEKLDHYICNYRGGIDGTGQLARAFSAKAQTYRHVLITAKDHKAAQRLRIPDAVLKTYRQTQLILANDTIGHLQSAHPLRKKINNLQDIQKDIASHTRMAQHQLIYVEIEHGTTASNKPGIVIRSMGHHFQYRWAYTSSVCHKNRLLDGLGQLRPELQNHPEEKANPIDHSPEQLTAARLLFGYALDGKNSALADDHYKRLAGRISFNHAVEVPGDKSDAQRFVNAGGSIMLKVLGQPRPSAVEFYLKQSKLPGQLTTYGDLSADSGGDLAGRKHYRHQPNTSDTSDTSDEKNNSLYQATAATNDRKERNDPDTERGTIVRYLSQPGSIFKTTLRIDSMRPWELGALMLALQPQLAEKMGLDIPVHELGYAHKLGYGKPLGLGSVRLRIDGARWQQADSWQWQQGHAADSAYKALVQECLAALKDKLRTTWGDNGIKPKILAWLQPRQWKAKGYAAYPQVSDKKGESTIFNFHTDLRKRHAAVRRGNSDSFKDLENLLNNKP